MPAPLYVSYGTEADGAGDVTYSLPSNTTGGSGRVWANGDLLLLFVETANQTVTAPIGWTKLLEAGTNTAGAANASALSVFWRIGKSKTFTVGPSDVCTCTRHGWVTGDIVRMTTTTTLPGGLATATSYFVIRTGWNTFKLASSMANAQAGTAINITSAGTGTHTCTDFSVTVTDPGDHQAGHTAAIANVDIGNPIGAYATSTFGSGTAVTAPSVTTTEDNSGLFVLAAGADDTTAWRGDTDWTNAAIVWGALAGHQTDVGVGGQLMGQFGTKATAGATGTSSADWTGSQQSSVTASIVINPAKPYVRGSTAPVTGLSTTSPASTEVNDLVVVVTGERIGGDGIPTHTLQSGFTQIASQGHDDGTTDGRLSVAYKVATVAGAQSYAAYTSSGAGTQYTGCFVLKRGTYDLAGMVSAATTNTGTNPPDPPVTASVTGDVLGVAIGFWHLTASQANTVTPPTGYTELWEIAASADMDLSVAVTTIQATAGTQTVNPGAFADSQTPNGTSSITIAIPARIAANGNATTTAAAQTDAATADVVTTTNIGQYGINVELMTQGTSPSSIALGTTTNGSSFLVCCGGKNSDIDNVPTDTKGNTYSLIDSVHTYTDWAGPPPYGTAAWLVEGGIGGATHTISQVITNSDEQTMFALELLDGLELEDFDWSQEANSGADGSQTSGSVTTAGPAMLVALWWGASPVTGSDMTAVPGNGFRRLAAYLTNYNPGFVQGAMAVREVESAGTYSCPWTHTPNQGAQLWLFAFKLPAGGGGGVTGAGATSAAAQLSAAIGSVRVVGAGASSAAAQTSLGAGAARITGTGATAASAQTTAGVGAPRAVGTGATSSSTQTTSGTGALHVAGAGASSSAAQTSSSAGAVRVQGSASSTASPQTTAGAAESDDPETIHGVGATAASSQTTAATGLAIVRGTGATAAAKQSSSAAGSAIVAGAGASSSAPQVSAGASADRPPVRGGGVARRRRPKGPFRVEVTATLAVSITVEAEPTMNIAIDAELVP